MWNKLIQTRNDPAALVLRLALAIMILPHGAQKVLGWFGGAGFSGTVGFMHGQLGIPVILAVVAIAVEFFGGLALLGGVLTRVAALGLGFEMLVAAAKVHLGNGFFMNWFGNQQGEGVEFHLLVVAMSLALVILGGGSFSADRALARQES